MLGASLHVGRRGCAHRARGGRGADHGGGGRHVRGGRAHVGARRRGPVPRGVGHRRRAVAGDVPAAVRRLRAADAVDRRRRGRHTGRVRRRPLPTGRPSTTPSATRSSAWSGSAATRCAADTRCQGHRVRSTSMEQEGLFGGGGPAVPAGSLAGADDDVAGKPLAVRMRPRTLDEIVGQQHLLGPGTPLRRLVEGDRPMSRWSCGDRPAPARPPSRTSSAGPPQRRFVELSAVTAGVKDVRADHRRPPGATSSAPAARPCCSSTRCTGSPRPSRTRCCPAVENRLGRRSSRPPPRTRTSR